MNRKLQSSHELVKMFLAHYEWNWSCAMWKTSTTTVWADSWASDSEVSFLSKSSGIVPFSRFTLCGNNLEQVNQKYAAKALMERWHMTLLTSRRQCCSECVVLTGGLWRWQPDVGLLSAALSHAKTHQFQFQSRFTANFRPCRLGSAPVPKLQISLVHLWSTHYYSFWGRPKHPKHDVIP